MPAISKSEFEIKPDGFWKDTRAVHAYVRRPWDVPDDRVQSHCSTKLDAAYTKGGCVAETDVS